MRLLVQSASKRSFGKVFKSQVNFLIAVEAEDFINCFFIDSDPASIIVLFAMLAYAVLAIALSSTTIMAMSNV